MQEKIFVCVKMILQKQTSRKYKEKEYLKYWTVIPSKIIKELKWEDKKELTSSIEDGKLIIKCK